MRSHREQWLYPIAHAHNHLTWVTPEYAQQTTCSLRERIEYMRCAAHTHISQYWAFLNTRRVQCMGGRYLSDEVVNMCDVLHTL